MIYFYLSCDHGYVRHCLFHVNVLTKRQINDDDDDNDDEFSCFPHNILCLQQVFLSLHSMEDNIYFVSRSFAHPRNVMSNNVSSFARAFTCSLCYIFFTLDNGVMTTLKRRAIYLSLIIACFFFSLSKDDPGPF